MPDKSQAFLHMYNSTVSTACILGAKLCNMSHTQHIKRHELPCMICHKLLVWYVIYHLPTAEDAPSKSASEHGDNVMQTQCQDVQANATFEHSQPAPLPVFAVAANVNFCQV